ncbi:MAG: ferrous iron transport protein B [Pseudomonadota bacterium]
MGADTLRVALAGNPNCGKTSLFNALTGAHQRVGNYPGVTVERRDGSYTHKDRRITVIDLPGTYSLSSWSPEERIAQGELEGGAVGVTVVVADSTNLGRSLVLLAQVMQLRANPVLVLNMADEARAAGQILDLDLLRALLGIPVVETVGSRREGIDALRDAIDAAATHPVEGDRLVLGGRLEEVIARIADRLAVMDGVGGALRWQATRLLVGDPVHSSRVADLGPPGAQLLEDVGRERGRLEKTTGLDIGTYVTERYFGFVDGLLQEVTITRPRADARRLSDRVDRILVHRLLGLPVFLGLMYGVFWMTFSLGDIPMGWIEGGFSALSALIAGVWPAGTATALRSLVLEGVISGVGGVIVFLPNILLLFLGLALLEDTGYMARAAFLSDRLMHRFGLHGKSFLPMVTGFGCTIPGIMGTRILENERDRLTTMMVLPLVPCGARLPIWMLLIPAFLPGPWRAPMLWFIYFFGALMALSLALLLRRTVLKGDDAPFVMELPPYRMPAVRGVLQKMLDRSWMYVRKAGTVILGISILLWIATSYPKPDVYRVDGEVAAGAALSEQEINARRASEDLEFSAAGRFGKLLEPVVAPLGFDWRLATGMVGAFAAKEVFVSQMGIVYSIGQADENPAPLRERLGEDYSPITGISLMLFLLIATPCMATVAVTRRESGSWKWAALQFGGLTTVAYILSLIVYQVGSRL